MSILAYGDTNVLIQGITGGQARQHTKDMLEYGTRIVAGVRPGSGGDQVYGVPVFNSIEDACHEHRIDASVLFIPAKAVKESALEAMNNGIRLLVIVTEHVPLHDAMGLLEEARKRGVTIIGPNTPGLISPPERTKLGFVPTLYFRPGFVGVASRSGTLTYELVSRLTAAGLGQSTVIGVGGDRIVGLRFSSVLKLFEEDPNTKAMLLVGEIGGTMEEEAAELIARGEIRKPVFVYIAGSTAPEGQRIGHAGAIIAGAGSSVHSKVAVLRQAGVQVGTTIAGVIEMMKENLR
ncbi:MAG: succinate--CoA ligase subunit alpha [Deltaproteobacteria bacterium]|nr:succinate--CoA ligase subunit alpha [Deltaproteobacteria bacterium]